MNYITGSAIRIKAELSETSGSVVTLKKLTSPTGETILEDEPMEFNYESNPDVATCVFQSDADTHIPGKYKYVVKVLNNGKTNLAKSYFYLEAE